jgi:hypothetical protein
MLKVSLLLLRFTRILKQRVYLSRMQSIGADLEASPNILVADTEDFGWQNINARDIIKDPADYGREVTTHSLKRKI